VQVTKHKEAQFPESNLPVCPQYSALTSLPDSKNLKLEDEVREEIGSEEFFDKSLKRLQGAVKIPTESFDDMGQAGEDPRWDVFVDSMRIWRRRFLWCKCVDYLEQLLLTELATRNSKSPL
jgi:hypothetical protein